MTKKTKKELKHLDADAMDVIAGGHAWLHQWWNQVGAQQALAAQRGAQNNGMGDIMKIMMLQTILNPDAGRRRR